MAIKQAPCRRSSELTVEEFKNWLMRFDTDRDGRISKEELRRAIRSLGARYSGWKSGRGVRGADANGDGFLDDAEIENLISFAQRSLGLKIVVF